MPSAQTVQNTLFINTYMCKILPGDSLCRLINLDMSGPRNYKIIRCLRIMILINCFMLIAFANIGFYFDANKHASRIFVPWQVLLVFKILVAVSGGFQLISIPFLIIWRIVLIRKLRARRRQEQEMIERRNDHAWAIARRNDQNAHRPEMDLESGRNPTSSDLFGHI